MPEHLERLRGAEYLVGAETDVEGNLFADLQVPGHLPVDAHPFRVLCGAFHMDVSVRFRFRQEAVVRFHAERHAPIDLNPFPAPEAVQLRRIPAPGARLDHQVRGLDACGLVFRQLPENGLLASGGRIAEEEFDEERLFLAGLRIVSGKGMPPPVVTLVGLGSEELAGIARNIVFVKPCLCHFRLFRCGEILLAYAVFFKISVNAPGHIVELGVGNAV